MLISHIPNILLVGLDPVDDGLDPQEVHHLYGQVLYTSPDVGQITAVNTKSSKIPEIYDYYVCTNHATITIKVFQGKRIRTERLLSTYR